MAAGDPDITTDELGAVLDRAEYKRRELALLDPTGPPQRWLVRAGETCSKLMTFNHLLNQSRLPDLPGSGDCLDEAACLAQTPCKHRGLWSNEFHVLRIIQYVE
jgi:hypothetical protein